MAELQDQNQFALERYKFLLGEIAENNKAFHKFLALFQTIASALTTAGLALFTGYRSWGLEPATVQFCLRGTMTLITVVGVFTIAFIVAGVFSWRDYRLEECTLTDTYVAVGFREPPQWRNAFRWYEPYAIVLIVMAMIVMWILLEVAIIPRVS